MAKSDNAAKMTLMIEKIIPRESKNGKPYWSIASAGEFYNTFDESVKDRLRESEPATVMVTSTESQGKTFHNIIGIAPSDIDDISADLEALSPPSSKLASRSAAVSQPVTDPMIDVRKTALLAANALLASEQITQKAMNDVLRKYERYIVHGLDVEHKNSSDSEGLPNVEDFVVNG